MSIYYLSAEDLTHHFQPHNMQNNKANISTLFSDTKGIIESNEENVGITAQGM